MRALKSVLVMAGSLKRQNPNTLEDIVLIRALRDSNLPKFLKDDAVLFQVGVCVCMEVCGCVCIGVWMYVWVCVSVDVCGCRCGCVGVYVRVCGYICGCVGVCGGM